jgi:hypothetical protein
MDYNIKYLKYKNKYINLKNMIGNGPDKLPSDHKKLTNAEIIPIIADTIIKDKLNIDIAILLMKDLKEIIDTTQRSHFILNLLKRKINNAEILSIKKLLANSISTSIVIDIIENKFDIEKVISLMEKLKGIKNTSQRSYLIFTLLIKNIPDDKIEFLNNNLFIYDYYIASNSSFDTILNFTEKQFDLLKQIIQKEYKGNYNIHIDIIIKKIKEIDPQTYDLNMIEPLIKKITENIAEEQRAAEQSSSRQRAAAEQRAAEQSSSRQRAAEQRATARAYPQQVEVRRASEYRHEKPFTRTLIDIAGRPFVTNKPSQEFRRAMNRGYDI